MDSPTTQIRDLLDELGVGPGVGRTIRHGELARALGVHPVHWSKVVNGERLAWGPGAAKRWASWDDFAAAVRRAAAEVSGARAA